MPYRCVSDHAEPGKNYAINKKTHHNYYSVTPHAFTFKALQENSIIFSPLLKKSMNSYNLTEFEKKKKKSCNTCSTSNILNTRLQHTYSVGCLLV